MRDYQDLYARLGIPDLPDDLTLQALTHVSAVYEQDLPHVASNERLEYLGDAVLELAVSAALYRRYPEASEGELTKIRAQLVCKENLSWVAAKLDLGSRLVFSKGEKRAGGARKPALLADALEAVFGCIFLVHGYAVAYEAAEKLLLEGQDLMELRTRFSHLWKSQLQEIVQREGTHHIEYRTTRSGSAHEPTFDAVLRVDGVLLGSGKGRSKREAEQAAAREAVLSLQASENETTP